MIRSRAHRSTAAVDYRHRVIDVDQPWRSAEYCVIDLETTGLDLHRDEIISYGAVPVIEGRIIARAAVYQLVRNPGRLSPASMVVHSLLPADLADAPSWEATVDTLLTALTGRVLVAHAAWVEEAFLGRGLKCRKVSPPQYVVDTAALARASGMAPRGEAVEPSLEGLAKALRFPGHAPHHALGDALMTAEVFLALTSHLPNEETLTARDLVHLSERYRLR